MSTRRPLYYALSLCLLFAVVLGAARTTAPQNTRPVARLAPEGEEDEPGNSILYINSNAPVAGPFFDQTVIPGSFDGDVRDLPQTGPDPNDLKLLPEFDVRRNAAQDTLGLTDPAVQTSAGALAMPSPAQNFAGLDKASWGGGWPPDTNGDVGPNHYIQTVNTSIGIYNKTGTQLAAFTLNTFFTGPGVTGTPCDNNNNGDPVVLYDPASDRWIVTDFAWADDMNGPYYECIAVSKGPNPVTDGWWFYAVDAGHNTSGDWLDDYPKLGVWQDGIYMGLNMFDCLNADCSSASFMGARAFAFNRTQLINGQALTPVYFDAPSEASLFPSNYRGTPPSNGTPNYFLGLNNTTSLVMYKFAPNWANLGASTFSGPQVIAVNAYSNLLTDIPQSGSATSLDTLSGRIMVQNQYRNVDGTESLWTNHTVSSSGVAGVRWYELRNLNTTPTVNQQSTFAPGDGIHRWMGSLAVDKMGNMALGYSASNGSMFPAIRYTGRLVGDAPSTLGQSEATLMAGTGSQSGIDRWGDYSAMTVDPTDDCTFWYTTEYYAATGSNWQTRIGSFKYPSCTTALAVSSISNQLIISNTNTGPLNFTVSSPNVPAASIVVTPTSSNQTLVPNGNLVLGGSGANRTVTVTPALNQTGVTTITLAIGDGTTTTSTAFQVSVSAQFNKIYLPTVSRDYAAPGTYTTIMQENFEGSFPGSWQLSDVGTNAGEYYWGKRTCKPYAGSYSGWGVGGGANGSGLGCGATYPLSVDGMMVYGPFSLAGATSADLSYQLWLNVESNFDKVCRLASTNGVDFFGTCTVTSTGGWISRTLDLGNVYSIGSVLGQPQVWVAIEFISDSSINMAEGGYVDNIVLRKCTAVSCPAAPVQAAPDDEGITEVPVQRPLRP